MTATWVVGVDGSENARHAAEWALDQAQGRDVRIVLLSTWNVPVVPAGFGAPVVWPDWSEFEAEIRRSTEALAAQLSERGVAVEARVAQGAAGRVLVEESRDADLLVVGARGLGGAKGVVLGSVSQRVVTHSTVPTAVITMEAPLGPARRMLIGYDGSRNARAAVTWGLGFAAPEASVTIVDALPVAPWLPSDVARQHFPNEVAQAEAEFETQMAEIDPGGRATHSFVVADARAALLEASQDVDLVVLGARGRGRLGTILLGSTTTWMLNGARVATVVVPAPKQ